MCDNKEKFDMQEVLSSSPAGSLEEFLGRAELLCALELLVWLANLVGFKNIRTKTVGDKESKNIIWLSGDEIMSEHVQIVSFDTTRRTINGLAAGMLKDAYSVSRFILASGSILLLPASLRKARIETFLKSHDISYELFQNILKNINV